MVISYEFLRFLEEEEKKRKVGLLLNLALNDENLRSYEFILIRQNIGYNSKLPFSVLHSTHYWSSRKNLCSLISKIILWSIDVKFGGDA